MIKRMRRYRGTHRRGVTRTPYYAPARDPFPMPYFVGWYA